MERGARGRTPTRRLTVAVLCLLLAVTCSPAAAQTPAQIQAATESVNAGGGDASSASYRIHDSIGQGAIGPMGEGTTIRAWDGFWLTLPNINVPVEAIFFGSLTEAGTVMLRWTVPELAGISGFNVYRATAEDGDYDLLNGEPLPAASPGFYEDRSVWPETTFWYNLRAVLADGTEEPVTGPPVRAETGGKLVAALHRPYPNPFRDEVTIRFDVPTDAGAVRLAVYNVRGQVVRVLEDGEPSRGRYTLRWDGRDGRGARAAAGVYFVRYEAAEDRMTEKILILR